MVLDRSFPTRFARRLRPAWNALGATHPKARRGLCAAAMAVSAWTAASAAGHMAEASLREGWKSAPGVILLSEVRPCEDGSFAAAVRYRYELAGSARVGERIAVDGPECGSMSFARRSAALWKVDQAVVVRYDDSSPGRPALVIGKSKLGAACVLAFSLVAFAAATFAAIAPSLRRLKAATAR